MAISNEDLVTRRSDVNRRLTFTEMDENFNQLKNAIRDILALEDNLDSRVSKNEYTAKVAEIENTISNIQAALLDLTSREVFELLLARVNNAEFEINVLKGRVDNIESIVL